MFEEILMMLGIKERPVFNIDTSKPFTKEDAIKAGECLKKYGDFYIDGELFFGLNKLK